MYQELLSYINSMENEWLKKLMEAFFVKDEAFLTNFKKIFRSEKCTSWICRRSAGAHPWRCEAVRLFCKILPDVKRDLLLAAAMCHDIGKTKRNFPFPTERLHGRWTAAWSYRNRNGDGQRQNSDDPGLSDCACFGIETLHFGAPRRI